MIQVTIEDLYAEATKALGESITRERILTAELRRLISENAALLAQVENPT